MAMPDFDADIRRLTEFANQVRGTDLYPHALLKLSYKLDDKFGSTKAVADGNEAIRVSRELLDIVWNDKQARFGVMHNLGAQLSDMSEHPDRLKYLHEAIELAYTVLESTPIWDPTRLQRRNALAVRLHKRFLYTENSEDLEMAIEIAQDVADTTSLDDENWASRQANLAVQLGHRYYLTKARKDLEKAISIGQRAVDSIPIGHQDRGLCLRGLTIRLSDMYLETGKLKYLNEAICKGREADSLTPKGHGDSATLRSNIGMCLSYRYSRSQSMEDLDNAIGLIRGAIADLSAANPETHGDMAGLKNNLGLLLGKKYERNKSEETLDEAIDVARESVHAIPESHVNRPLLLNNLAIRLGEKFSLNTSLQDLDEAIKLSRQTVEANPDHPYRAGWLINLRNLLDKKYSYTRLESDRETAIEASYDAIKATSSDNPVRCTLLKGLGDQLLDRYQQEQKVEDFSESMQHFRTALYHEESPISDRIAAGRQLLLSFPTSGERPAQEMDEDAEATIDLITLLAPKSLQVTDKQYLLSGVVGFASDAAAIALAVKREPIEAISRLERGRGVLASSLQDLRTDLSRLQENHPELASSFLDIRDTLDRSYWTDLQTKIGDSSPGSSPDNASQFLKAEVDKRHEANEQMQLLVQDIRAKDGFERFLLPLSEAEMRETASQGPIVIVNVSIFRCDALVIDESGVREIPLDELSRDAILEQNSDSMSVATLSWLWEVIVSPVFKALKLNMPGPGDSPKRIWWIPTGPLVGFPLHAAGDHLKGNGNTTLDRVISSYSSTIKTIMHTRQQPSQDPSTKEPGRAVLIAMAQTIGLPSLQNVVKEKDEVQQICTEMQLNPVSLLEPSAEEALYELQDCQVFHFAGHGSAQVDPLQSRLLLQDWKVSPLTVERMMGINVSSKPPFLAYLSACRTGQIKDKKLVDESIHLTTAFQLAGFRHVVGTLWQVDDAECVAIAKSTYEYMEKNDMSDSSVSSGLHQALRQSRDRWIKGCGGTNADRGRDIVWEGSEESDESEEDMPMPSWVPYVHYGV
ncbi:unnamed protein product [Clonostachys rosea]|uniref:CHAT domain-containing protein n=1 Tax=Bionectria ochroleuca TaxID=29856 RepID=A0ABY6U9U1_BIOOC|nr:unnamed protein product [Clonostachys rosea]